MDVKPRITSSFHAQAKCAAERTNQTIKTRPEDSCRGEAAAAECGPYPELVDTAGHGRDLQQQRANCEHVVEPFLPASQISPSFLA